MSKSKGNIITPESLIQEQGADVIRYWASNSKLGMDIVYSEQTFKIGKKLITKLWNAAKFVNTHICDIDHKAVNLNEDVEQGKIYCDIDLWILSSLHKVVGNATTSLQQYEYCDARVYVEEFFWKHFCDNYLELVKTRVYDEEGKHSKEKLSAKLTLYNVFQTLLKLFAPYLPHITEEISTNLFKNKQPITQINTWPKLESHCFEQKYLELGNVVINILELVRKYKSINELSLRSEIGDVVYSGNKISDSALIDLKNASNSAALRFEDKIKDANSLQSNCGKYKVLIS
jgi:valyl-tRNA synthetase